MSIQVMSRIWAESHQRGGSLLVLLAIADFANDEGCAFPSVHTLANKSRLSESQVHHILRGLQISRELRIDRNAGPHRSNIYRVQFPEGATHSTVQFPEGATGNSERVLPVIVEGATHSTQTVMEPSMEPSSKDLFADAHKSLEDSPDWFLTLNTIPGFKTSLPHARKFLTDRKISEDHAEDTAYALKSKWPGAKTNPYKDPWATFQAWVKRPPLQGPPGRTKVSAPARAAPAERDYSTVKVSPPMSAEDKAEVRKLLDRDRAKDGLPPTDWEAFDREMERQRANAG